MSTNRRDFIKTIGATGAALAASDLVGTLIAQSPKGRVLESKFKGLSDIALGEAKRLGATYCDVRFSRNLSDSVTVRDRIVGGGGFGGGGGGGFGGGGGRNESAGFGVRVLHSGVWGFASSPHVTDEQVRAITRQAVDVARASAVAKRFDVRLTPTPAYQTYWSTPITVDPFTISLDDKIAFLLGINEQLMKTKGIIRDPVVDRAGLRVEVLRVERGLLHRTGVVAHGAELLRDRPRQRQGQVADLHRAGPDGWLRSGHRRRNAGERRPHRGRSGGTRDGTLGVGRSQGHRHDARRTRC